MADARALLRAHRAENRIKHPLAAYSDAGKLFCKLCQDAVKTESLWDMHIRSQTHGQRLLALREQQQNTSQVSSDSTNKRKRSENADEPMSDADQDPDASRTKRSKTDVVTDGSGNGAESNRAKDNDKTTPWSPRMARRPSGTPGHGIGITIPSRPATPLPSANSAVSPMVASIGRSPLASSAASSMSGISMSALSQQAPPALTPMSTDSITMAPQPTTTAPSTSNTVSAPQTSSGDVDEAEWAAFEAEMSVLDAPAQPAISQPASGSSNLFNNATISAPAMTTAQVAAKSQEEENERLKQAAEAEMEDEREEATRALETEFEDMEELEGRVRRLKERREQLRRESVMNIDNAAALKTNDNDVEKENLPSAAGGAADEQDDDDDDDDEDEWDGFRFRP